MLSGKVHAEYDKWGVQEPRSTPLGAIGCDRVRLDAATRPLPLCWFGQCIGRMMRCLSQPGGRCGRRRRGRPPGSLDAYRQVASVCRETKQLR